MLIALDDIGYRQTGLALDGERADAAAGETVDPHNLIGIEKNPRAAAIAEVVLWIGYLQWHFRTRGDVRPPQPVIRDFRNIETRDAVLAWDDIEFVLDEHGVPVTRWDGETMKVSPVTGEKVPDETARRPVEQYINPRKAAWPEADFIVGNPPFIGNKRMRTALGDGYVEALRGAWEEMPESADFVMYWWHHAAQLTRRGAVERFGFITTNSIRQSFNRRVLEPHLADKKQPLSLVFAIPDHPWVDTADGAAVRIAMTVAAPTDRAGALYESIEEVSLGDGELAVRLSAKKGAVNEDLTVGVNVSAAFRLLANRGLALRGITLVGTGFVVDREQAEGLGAFGGGASESHVRPFFNGRDLTQTPREAFVIDLFGLEERDARVRFPELYQWLWDRVKLERDQNARETYRKRWWVFAEPRSEFRVAARDLDRYIVTPMTAKHRIFTCLAATALPDQGLVPIALQDSINLGVLSSIVHSTWALRMGGTLEDRPRYNQSACFETFPFPNFPTADKFGGPIGVALVDPDGNAGRTETYGEYPSDRVRNLAEQLDAHRKRQQAAHPGLTLTGMYNVLEKLRSGDVLTDRERTIHEQGIVSVLRQLHDELDEAVLYAYGWGDLLPLLQIAHGNDTPAEGQTRDDAKRAFDEAILERLVALNAQRAAAEARGDIQWLRPEFQNPTAHREPEQRGLDTTTEEGEGTAPATTAPITAKPIPWPKDTVAQVRAVADVLTASPVPLSIDEIAARFTARGPWKKRLPKLLEMLVALGRAVEQDGKLNAA